jgi:tetratricopeptide (TPR) repeat protein
VLGHLGDDAKQSGHARLAVALEASPRPDAEALAEHWRGAGDIDKAADYAARAAEEAQSAFAFESRGPPLSARAPPSRAAGRRAPCPPQRLADALANAGRGAEAAEMYLEAGLGANRGEALELRRRAATQLLLSGHVEEGLSTLRTVLNDLGLKFPQSTAAAIRGRLLRRAWLRVRGLSFEERDPSMIADAERVRIECVGRSDSDSAPWIRPRIGLPGARAPPGARLRRRVPHLPRAFARGRLRRIRRRRARTRGTRALRTRRRTREVTQSAHAQGVTALARAFALYLWGRYADAIPQARRAEQIFRERCNGAQTELDIAIHVLLRSLFFLGDFVSLHAQMPIHLREAGERGNLYALHGLRTGHLIGCWLADDDPDGALVELEDAAQGSWEKGNASDLRRTQVFIGTR